MHGIYDYLLKTNHVSCVYSVAAVVYLRLVLHVMLFLMLNLFCTVTLVLSALCAVPSVTVFCSSLMFLRYFLNYFEMDRFAAIFTGINFVFTFHMTCIYIARF